MPAKRFSDNPFDTVSVCGARQCFFSSNYSKSGIFKAVAHKKYFEIFVFEALSVNDMIETIFTQQPMCGGKSASQAKRQVWSGPWHGVH